MRAKVVGASDRQSMGRQPRSHASTLGTPSRSRSHAPRFALSLLLATLSAGCRLVQTAVDVPTQTVRAVTPGMKPQKTVDVVEMEQTLLRFGDEFSTRMTLGVDKLRR